MGDGNFVALDGANDSICDDSIKNMGNLRYCDGDQTMVHLSAESLEERVKANTGDVNSWILLAIIQLQLDVTCRYVVNHDFMIYIVVFITDQATSQQ